MTKLNLTINQGCTFSQEFQLFDAEDDILIVSNTMSVEATMKKTYSSSNSVVLTTALANGSLTLSLSANQTTNIVAGRYVWDAELTDTANGFVTRLIEGIATVKPDVEP